MLRPLSHFLKDPAPAAAPIPQEHYVAGLDASGKPIPHAISLSVAAAVLPSTEPPGFSWGCTGCGGCCSGPGAVYFTADDLEAIRLHLGSEASEWSRMRKRLVQKREQGLFVHQTDRACILLDGNNRCSVYPVRPLQCRTYPFWSSCFEDGDSFDAFQKACPGSQNVKGRRYGLRELVARVNATADLFRRSQTGRGKSLYL